MCQIKRSSLDIQNASLHSRTQIIHQHKASIYSKRRERQELSPIYYICKYIEIKRSSEPVETVLFNTTFSHHNDIVNNQST